MERKRLLDTLQHCAEFGLGAVIIGVPISNATVSIGLGFLWFFWGLRKIIARDFSLPLKPVFALFGLFAAAAVVSLFHSVDGAASLNGLRKLLKSFMFVWAAAETVNSPRAFARAMGAALIGFFLVSVDGVYQFAAGRDFIRGNLINEGLHDGPVSLFLRLTASMRGPNEFATYLSAMLPLVICLLLYGDCTKARIPLIAGAVLGIFCLCYTHFRGAALAFVLSMLALVAIKRDLRVAAVLCAGLILLPFVLPKEVVQWASAHRNPFDFFVEKGGRRWHWEAALNMIKDHPLVGVGVNTFAKNYDAYKTASDPLSNFYAHNSYLHIGAEVGLPGLALFLALIAVVMRRGCRAYRVISSPRRAAAALGCLVGFSGLLVASVFDTTLQSSNLVVLFWFMAVMTARLPVLAASERKR